MFPRRTSSLGSDDMDKKTGIFLLYPTFFCLLNTSSQKCDEKNLLTTPNVNKNKHFHRWGLTGFKNYFHFFKKKPSFNKQNCYI